MNKEKFKDILISLFENMQPKTDEELFSLYEKTFVPEAFNILKDIFTGYFRQVEGSSCSADKGRFVARKLVESVQKKETFNLKLTYADHQASGGKIGIITELDELCYWCPETIADTKEALNLYNRITSLDFEFILLKIKESRLEKWQVKKR